MGGNDKVVQRMDNFFEKVRGWALPNFTVENEPDFCAPYAFFFQAEDGIRHGRVTGVQTCALPIYPGERGVGGAEVDADFHASSKPGRLADEVWVAAPTGRSAAGPKPWPHWVGLGLE